MRGTDASRLRLREGALKRGTRGLAVLALLAGGSASSAGQQVPTSGCGAAVSCSGPRGFSTLTGTMNPNVFGISNVVWRSPEIRLDLPPPPEARDRAIEASAAIVLGRNRKLRENLAVAQAAAVSARPAGAVQRASRPRRVRC